MYLLFLFKWELFYLKVQYGRFYLKAPVCRNWVNLRAEMEYNMQTCVFIQLPETKNCCVFVTSECVFVFVEGFYSSSE